MLRMIAYENWDVEFGVYGSRQDAVDLNVVRRPSNSQGLGEGDDSSLGRGEGSVPERSCSRMNCVPRQDCYSL